MDAVAPPPGRQCARLVQRAQRVVFGVFRFLQVLGGLPEDEKAAWVPRTDFLASSQAVLFSRGGNEFESRTCVVRVTCTTIWE